MAATPFVPRVAARFGMRPMLAGSILVGAAILPLFYLVADFWLWFPLRFLSGGAIATTFVLSEFWIADDGAARRSAVCVMGIYATVLSIGFALGPGVLALTGTSGALALPDRRADHCRAALPVILAPVKSPTIDEHPHGGVRPLSLHGAGGDRRGVRLRHRRKRQLRAPAGLWQPSRPRDAVGACCLPPR